MQKFYCVTSSFDNRGRATAAITDCIRADKCPENTSTSTSRKDIYNDWFLTQKAAESFVRATKSA